MLKLEKYVGELLYEHDCVIVPGFGGFIGNAVPAHVDTAKNLFEPPQKQLFFNKGLIQNDGLLANHIATVEKISYTEALNFITDKVNELRKSLAEVKRIVFDNIGTLYFDDQHNLMFIPDGNVNYLRESFGLASFYRKPVELKIKPYIAKKKNNVTKYAVAATVAILLLLAIGYSISNKGLGHALSGLTFFSKKEPPQYSFSKADYSSVTGINKKHILPDSSFVISSKREPEILICCIVAGCFRYPENANKLIRMFKRNHIELALLGKDNKGLYRVGLSNLSRSEAEKKISDFRSKAIKDAWVYIPKQG